ncbi:uncharacterized protein LOC131658880 [Vicia villosa]|uniref:uncharacterized protein LOC131658880 n=1 Tax=Vicia villosa TaxID=3911 RepID=UPI00273C0D50|nr:uncharacterized protein LOC131658880 [Vicia villosa]
MASEAFSISSNLSHSRRRRLQCYCGLDAPLVTSWTSQNPGRRFYGCGLYKLQGRKGCAYFEWYDEQLEERSNEVINSLLKKVNKLKKELLIKKTDDKLKKKVKFLVTFLVLSWVVILVLLLKIVVG